MKNLVIDSEPHKSWSSSQSYNTSNFLVTVVPLLKKTRIIYTGTSEWSLTWLKGVHQELTDNDCLHAFSLAGRGTELIQKMIEAGRQIGRKQIQRDIQDCLGVN